MEYVNKAMDFVGKHPVASLAIGLGIGAAAYGALHSGNGYRSMSRTELDILNMYEDGGTPGRGAAAGRPARDKMDEYDPQKDIGFC